MSGKNNTHTPLDLWHLEMIGLLEARKNGFTGTGKGVEVLVLDTRPQLSHPVFEKSDVVLYVLEETVSPSNSPYILKVIQKEEFPSLVKQQVHPHGTGVLGLLCGREIGVSPDITVFFICLEPSYSPDGWGCDERKLRFSLSEIEQSFVDKLINLSICLSTDPDSDAAINLREICSNLAFYGCSVFVGSGNDGEDKQTLPSFFGDVLSVGSCNKKKQIWPKSGSGICLDGSHFPFLVAPGEKVLSSTTGGVLAEHDGTSYATPIAVGVAALLLEQNPDLYRESP